MTVTLYKIPAFRSTTVATLLGVLAMFAAPTSHAGKHNVKGAESKPDALYHSHCSACHGDRGDGRSRTGNSLVPPPRDFTTAGELTREAMITIITHGKPGTAMVGWNSRLNVKEIESLTDYIRSTFMIVALDPKFQKGKSLYAQNCVACHGAQGQGSPLPIGGSVPARDLASPKSRAELSRDRMIRSVTVGRPGTAMPGFGGRLAAADIEAVVDFVRRAIMVPRTNISGPNAHTGQQGPRLHLPPRPTSPPR